MYKAARLGGVSMGFKAVRKLLNIGSSVVAGAILHAMKNKACFRAISRCTRLSGWDLLGFRGSNVPTSSSLACFARKVLLPLRRAARSFVYKAVVFFSSNCW